MQCPQLIQILLIERLFSVTPWPDRIGDGRAAEPTVDHWFDTTAFQRTADNTGTFGTAGRNIVRGPGQFNLDLSLIKTTRLGRVESELRIEAFNLLNSSIEVEEDPVVTRSFRATTAVQPPASEINCAPRL